LKRDDVDVRDAGHAEGAERDDELPPGIGGKAGQWVSRSHHGRVIILHVNLDDLSADGAAVCPESQIRVGAGIEIRMVERDAFPDLASKGDRIASGMDGRGVGKIIVGAPAPIVEAVVQVVGVDGEVCLGQGGVDRHEPDSAEPEGDTDAAPHVFR